MQRGYSLLPFWALPALSPSTALLPPLDAANKSHRTRGNRLKDFLGSLDDRRHAVDLRPTPHYTLAATPPLPLANGSPQSGPLLDPRDTAM
jgi:hypothetical protein